MADIIDSYCGLKCLDCTFKVSHRCGGCIASNGNPFHGKCETAECAKERGKRFCGECEDFPCEIIIRYSNDPEHGDSGARIERCRLIKSALVAEARKGISLIGVCGHHCDYCFLGQWCGGCRSKYNCCSFATVCDGGVCPNVSCAEEKSLDGCFMCDEVFHCSQGYYGNKNEYIAKAAALFIKKHGGDCYTKTLKRAIDTGENYPKAFDETGSVENALGLLEKYLQPHPVPSSHESE